MFLTSLIEALGYTHKREAVQRRRRPLSIDVLEDRRLLAGVTWTVDDDFAAFDAAHHHSPTIQAAVTAANAGDKIQVKPGTYNESVTVDNVGHSRNGLQIIGSQNDANQALKNPSKLTNATIVEVPAGLSNGFHLVANDIVIRAITIQDSDSNGDPVNGTVGVNLDRSTSGDTIANNILQNLSEGIYLNTSGAHKTTVQDNLIRNNNDGFGVAAAAGNGIYSDQGASNVVVQHNYFTGDLNAAILFVDTGPSVATDKSNLTIKDNTLDHDGSMAFTNGTGIHVVNNTSISPVRSGVFFGGGVTNSEVSNNKLTNGGTNGIALVANAFGNAPGANSNIQIANNKISGFAVGGIDVNGADHVTMKNNDVNGNASGITLEGGDNNNTVQNNHVESNTGVGILLNGSTLDTVSNNDVKKNGGGGISLQGDSMNQILNNHLDSNAAAGILLSGSTGDTVSKNDVKKSAGDGILLDTATGNTVDHNNLDSNGTPAAGMTPAAGDGIHLLNSSTNTVSNNNVKKSAVDGILLENSTGNTVSNNSLDSNGVKAKGATAGTGDGIHADSGSTGNTFDHNDSKNNGHWDYEDNSAGTGTAGTANTWTKNKGKTQNRPGLIG